MLSDLPAQELPLRSQRSEYRIRIPLPEDTDTDSLKPFAESVCNDLRVNTFLLSKEGEYILDAGDYRKKSYARNKLSRVREKFKKARIVKADNESVISFNIYETRKKVPKSDAVVVATRTIPELPENIEKREAWADRRYRAANTAAFENYLTDKEKLVYVYLNLCRMNPSLFADVYMPDSARNASSDYRQSLFNDLKSMDTLCCLHSDKQLFESAMCHAVEAGERGYVGHERVNCHYSFGGECCQYGSSDPLNIVMQLLVDEGIPSLGHRHICLGHYDKLGVAIRPHEGYGSNAVLDFW